MKGQGAVIETGETAACGRALAPFPTFPYALVTMQLSLLNRRENQKIAFERKEHGRTFVVAIKWQNGGADFAMRAQRDVNVVSVTQIRSAISDR